MDVTNCFKFLLWLSHNDRLATLNCQPNEPFLPGSCFCRGVSSEATGNRHGPVCVSGHSRSGQKTALGYWFFPSVVGCKNRTQGIRLAQQVFLPAGSSCWPSCFKLGYTVLQQELCRWQDCVSEGWPPRPPSTQPLSVVILFFSVDQGASSPALPASASQGLGSKVCRHSAQ